MNKLTTLFSKLAIFALTMTLLNGVFAVGHYIAALSPKLHESVTQFGTSRAMHTMNAAAWIMFSAVAVIYHYLTAVTGSDLFESRRRTVQSIALCVSAGYLIAANSLISGYSTGREYLEFYPLAGLFILLAWLIFGWQFLSAVRPGFWDRPIYVTMWATSVFFFAYTLCEQYAWLLPSVFDDHVVDMRLQWKACGTIVGSLNLLVYGTAYYIGEKLSGNEELAKSKTAYALFAVGLLNSFTNFGHHAYHLPQSELVKWISFVVSMLEAILFVKVMFDIASSVRLNDSAAARLLRASKWWSAFTLLTAVIISIPPINSVIHGTHVVVAHSMSATTGIDSFVMLAALFYLFAGSAQSSKWLNCAIVITNIALGGLVVVLSCHGLEVGLARLNGRVVVDNVFPVSFAVHGAILTLSIGFVTRALWKLVRSSCVQVSGEIRA